MEGVWRMRKTVLRRLGHFRSTVLRPIWAWLIAGLLSFVSLLAFARDEFLAPDIAQQYRLLRWAPSWPWYWWALAFAGTILCVVFEGSFRSAERQRPPVPRPRRRPTKQSILLSDV